MFLTEGLMERYTVFFIHRNQTGSWGQRWGRPLAVPGRDIHFVRMHSGTVNSIFGIISRRYYGQVSKSV